MIEPGGYLVTNEEERVDTKSHHQKPNVHNPIKNHICFNLKVVCHTASSFKVVIRFKQPMQGVQAPGQRATLKALENTGTKTVHDITSGWNVQTGHSSGQSRPDPQHLFLASHQSKHGEHMCIQSVLQSSWPLSYRHWPLQPASVLFQSQPPGHRSDLQG